MEGIQAGRQARLWRDYKEEKKAKEAAAAEKTEAIDPASVGMGGAPRQYAGGGFVAGLNAGSMAAMRREAIKDSREQRKERDAARQIMGDYQIGTPSSDPRAPSAINAPDDVERAHSGMTGVVGPPEAMNPYDAIQSARNRINERILDPTIRESALSSLSAKITGAITPLITSAGQALDNGDAESAAAALNEAAKFAGSNGSWKFSVKDGKVVTGNGKEVTRHAMLSLLGFAQAQPAEALNALISGEAADFERSQTVHESGRDDKLAESKIAAEAAYADYLGARAAAERADAAAAGRPSVWAKDSDRIKALTEVNNQITNSTNSLYTQIAEDYNMTPETAKESVSFIAQATANQYGPSALGRVEMGGQLAFRMMINDESLMAGGDAPTVYADPETGRHAIVYKGITYPIASDVGERLYIQTTSRVSPPAGGGEGSSEQQAPAKPSAFRDNPEPIWTMERINKQGTIQTLLDYLTQPPVELTDESRAAWEAKRMKPTSTP